MKVGKCFLVLFVLCVPEQLDESFFKCNIKFKERKHVQFVAIDLYIDEYKQPLLGRMAQPRR